MHLHVNFYNRLFKCYISKDPIEKWNSPLLLQFSDPATIPFRSVRAGKVNNQAGSSGRINVFFSSADGPRIALFSRIINLQCW